VKKGYVVTAEFTIISPAEGKGAARTVFFPDTFVVMTDAVR
jgi:hypothetical protein